MPIVTQYGQVGDISNIITRRQNQANADWAELVNSYERQRAEKSARYAARNAEKATEQKADELKQVAERSVGMDRVKAREINPDTEAYRESPTERKQAWNDELTIRLKNKAIAEEQADMQRKYAMAQQAENMAAQRRLELANEQGRIAEERARQKAIDTGKIVLTPGANKQLSDLQNQLSQVSNSPWLTERDRIRNSERIKSKIASIKNNRDSYRVNEQKPPTVRERIEAGEFEISPDGSMTAIDKNGKLYSYTPPDVEQRNKLALAAVGAGVKENKEANTLAWNTHLTKVQVLNTQYKEAASTYEKMLNNASVLPADKARAEKAMNKALEALTAQVNTPPERIIIQPQQVEQVAPQQPVVQQSPTPQYKVGQIVAYKGQKLKFMGGNPKDRKSWKLVSGGR